MAFPPSHHHDAFIFQSLHEYPNDPSSIPFLPSCPPQFSHDAESVMKRSMSFSSRVEQGMTTISTYNQNDQEQVEEDLSDDGSMQMLGEKKKRLNHEQVRALEKSFESRNKLEAETKVQLARALGLQPRQVAIWFQNRRARWKTKQLERDYEVLKKQFASLKADNDALLAHNRKLNAQLVALKNSWETSNEVQMKKEREQGSWSDNSNSDNINLNMSRSSPISNDHHLMVHNQDENFCSMLTSIDEQQQGWAWLHQNLQLH